MNPTALRFAQNVLGLFRSLQPEFSTGTLSALTGSLQIGVFFAPTTKPVTHLHTVVWLPHPVLVERMICEGCKDSKNFISMERIV